MLWVAVHCMPCHAVYTRTIYNFFSSEQPIGIVIALKACVKLHLTNQLLTYGGATNAR